MSPLEEKFAAFGWDAAVVDGHDVRAVHEELSRFKAVRQGRPKVLVADTIKGKGVPILEQDALCHVRTLNEQEALAAMGEVESVPANSRACGTSSWSGSMPP